MSDGVPEGWLPTPFGVPDDEAVGLAAQLTRTAAESMPGFVDGDDARAAMAATIARLPVTDGVIGRVWHVLGPDATGAIVDLSVDETTGPVPDSPFALAVPQRTVPFDGGRAVMSFVAPAEHLHVTTLLRVQRRDAGRTLIADALETPAVIGLIIDDVIAIVGGNAPARPEDAADV